MGHNPLNLSNAFLTSFTAPLLGGSKEGGVLALANVCEEKKK